MCRRCLGHFLCQWGASLNENNHPGSHLTLGLSPSTRKVQPFAFESTPASRGFSTMSTFFGPWFMGPQKRSTHHQDTMRKACKTTAPDGSVVTGFSPWAEDTAQKYTMLTIYTRTRPNNQTWVPPTQTKPSQTHPAANLPRPRKWRGNRGAASAGAAADAFAGLQRGTPLADRRVDSFGMFLGLATGSLPNVLFFSCPSWITCSMWAVRMGLKRRKAGVFLVAVACLVTNRCG